jgi:hypothetical protein
MDTAIIQTYYGVFRATITKNYDRDRITIREYVLSIRGKKKEGNNYPCFSVSIPADTTQHNAHISWIEYNDTCHIKTYEPGKSLSQHLVHLACTIIKDKFPHITHITLQDMSKITCELPPPNNKVVVSLPNFYIAFHGKTWYEDKFDARIQLDDYREEYNTLLRNFDDPSHKPAWFNFGNEHLADVLYPLYDASSTWREFFYAIAAKYGSDKCTIIYPWLNNALMLIMDQRQIYEGVYWIFDINNPKIKHVKYNVFANSDKYDGGRGGTGPKYTRKRTRTPHAHIADIRVHYDLDYAAWLAQKIDS